ncbi:hypothetical protein L249_3766, partial [Ophiocordyceps polyrhachis-furcata BCC 54312]
MRTKSKGYTSREVFVLRRYFSRYFKVPTCSTLTYLYKIGDLEEDLYVPYPA